MLDLKVIGAGAAGNKAVIQLVKEGEFNKDRITLINSTMKDVDPEFKDSTIIFGANSTTTLGGCGKERTIGKKLILSDMRVGAINLDNLIDPHTSAVVIVSSTEGGSGSAVTPVLAKYIKEVLGVPVIVVLFFGFNADVRGMQNSIEICQELTEDYGVIGICNHKFLDKTNGNRMKAEQLANKEFINIMEILTGRNIRPSSQNIDDTDLYKIVTTPGYMRIETANVTKVKNSDQVSKAIIAAIDDSPLMDCSATGTKRIGMIINANPNIMDFVDIDHSDVVSRYGPPYEFFIHVQENEDKEEDTITWIATGLHMPIDEIQAIYDNYIKQSAKVNKSEDEFFSKILDMKGNHEDGMFDSLTNPSDKRASKSSFFADFGIEDNNTRSSSKVNITTGNKQKDNSGEY